MQDFIAKLKYIVNSIIEFTVVLSDWWTNFEIVILEFHIKCILAFTWQESGSKPDSPKKSYIFFMDISDIPMLSELPNISEQEESPKDSITN